MTFLIDLWQDLREKRLWPVAVGLLAATVAVPFMLFKPTSAPPAQPPLPTAARGAQLPVVSVANGPIEGSRLGQFSAKNPFVPLSQLAATAKPGTPAQPQAPAQAAVASSSGGSPSGSGGAATHVSSPAGGGGGSTPSTTTPPSSGMHWFHYTVDVKFGAPGHLKTLKGLKTMSLLPSEKNPVVVYLGAANDGADAVFLVDDPSYTAHGKGHCNAPGDACRFVTLNTTNNSETFTSADGQSQYKLVLDRINRVFFTPGSTSGSKVTSASFDSTAPDMLSLTGIGQALPGGGSEG